MVLGSAPHLRAERLAFTSYTGFDGLPQSQVLALAEDARGFLWLGTYGGLTRYNGHRFLTLTTEDGLSSNAVSSLALDQEGRLWVGTLGGGVSVVDRGRVVMVLRAPGELAGNYVQDITVTPDGAVWVATDSGASRILGSSVTHFTTKDGLPSNDVSQVLQVPDGKILAATGAGLARLEGDRFTPVDLPEIAGVPVRAILATDSELLAGTEHGLFSIRDGHARRVALPGPGGPPRIVAMAQATDGTIWVGSRGGAYRLSHHRVRRMDTRNGLLDDFVHRVMVDRSGIVWFGTDSGLSKLVPNPFTAFTSEDWLANETVRAISEDARGGLWFGTRNGISILRGEKTLAVPGTALPDPRVYALAPLPDGRMLAGTGSGLCLLDDARVVRCWHSADGMPGRAAVALAAVPGRNQVWVGTNAGTVLWRDGRLEPPPDPVLSAARPLALRVAPSGVLWVGLRAGGVLTARRGRVVSRLGSADGLTDETVWALAPDGTGGMWVGSNGDGAFHIVNGEIHRLSTAEGLVDNFVWQVLPDRRGDVWFYTSRGLDRLAGRRIRHFGRADGLLDLEGMAGACLEDSTGILWFASASGLMRYDPGAETRPPPPPSVSIESFESSRRGTLAPGARLPYPAGTLLVELASPWYRDESSLRFSHRLLPADEAWSPPSKNPLVTLAALRPGGYRLEAVAVDADGRRSAEPAVLRFSILPPWWERPESLVGLGMAVLLLIAAVNHARTRRMEAERRRLEELVAERTRELRRLAITDELTGTANRRRFTEVLREEAGRLSRAPEGCRLSLLLIDLDGFKEINDTWGHEVGDRLLAAIGKALHEAIRSTDLVARYGGDEFAVILPMTGREGALHAASKILEKVEAVRVQVPGGTVGITASIGVAVVAPSTVVEEEIHQLIRKADTALYAAKKAGGHRVHVEGEDPA